MHQALHDIFIFLAAACIIVPLSSRLKLGSVIGYLLAGIIIGPHALKLISTNANVSHIAEFGVVMMLFLIGLELEPAALWRLRKFVLGLGGLQVLLTTALFFALGRALGASWQQSLIVGAALSLSSTALVLQMLKEKEQLTAPQGQSAFSILLFQDIAVIPLLIIMPLLSLKGGQIDSETNAIDHLSGLTQVLIILSVIIMLIVFGRFFSYFFFREIAKTKLREIFTSVSLALIVGITLLMQLIGISPALGAFVAGVVLANSHYKHTLETDIEPFKGLLLGLFFISVGMGIDFILLKEKFLWLLLAVATLIVVKFIVIYALARLFRFTNLMAIGFGLTLAQGGEFAFVLFQYAGNFSIIPKENSDFLTLIVALSILFTPLIMVVFERFSAKFAPKAGENTIYDKVDEQNSIIIAGFGRFGQIIGRFLIANGIKVTILEKNPDQIELLRKFNIQGYFGDATRLDLLESAKAAQAKILIVAVDDVQAGLDIVALARDHFPHLKIFARARNRRHAYELDRLGVDVFKREVFESALSLAKDLMLSLGRNEEEIAKKINEFRRHDEETLRNSFSFMDDESQLINFTKMRRTELEAILQGDNAQIKAK